MRRSTTVRIEAATHDRLSALAEAEDITMQEALNRAIEAYERDRFFATLRAQYAALSEDDLREEADERALWETAEAADARL